jgi:hypothetical protein
MSDAVHPDPLDADRELSRVVDFIFLLALTTLVLAGGYIVYWVF